MYIGWIALVALGITGSDQAEAQVLVDKLTTCQSLSDQACLVAAARLTLLGDEALPLLEKRFWEFPREAQLLALGVIDGVDGGRATDLIAAIVKDQRPDPAVRALALDDLSSRRYRGLIALLTRAAKDKAPIVRVAAARGLSNHLYARDPKVLATLIKVASDERASVRIEALFGLGFSAHPDAGRPLTVALADPEPDVRRAAAEGLGLVKHRAAVRRLVPLLDDKDQRLVHAVVRALRFQTGEDFGPDPRRWQEWLQKR
ncbi:MAG: hypothetical protein CVU56_05695 [Deltaproteobacteria bacterium HGW-Deltaproteobacteria-14]|jgi:HEAT repeat protein|nr:MAG: hypothetical protein CVU56_05695 [Deltaproteobacteria bacterium HGW-Deltaproteobacteria-14]